MTPTEAAIVSALFGAQSAAILFLALGLARTREKLVRVEQRLDDLRNGR